MYLYKFICISFIVRQQRELIYVVFSFICCVYLHNKKKLLKPNRVQLLEIKTKIFAVLFISLLFYFQQLQTNGMLIYNKAKTLNSYQEFKRNFVAKKYNIKQKAKWLLKELLNFYK